LQYRPEPLRERDKYRGRRRVPSPPRSRYVGVVTSALVGAGIVALGAGAAVPDAKADVNSLDGTDSVSQAELDRTLAADAASRSDRSAGPNTSTTATQDGWLLPVRDYTFSSPFGASWGKLHSGVDLAIREGTPYTAVHGGKVILAQWYGGYGYCVMVDHGDGLVTVYGHSSRLLVKPGDTVKAGQILGLVGSTGHSTGPHLHLEIHVDGKAVDPVPWFKQHGVDLKLQMESVY
jgi:murein DD-endopeptidase MepM/ murein hydrolase activator NlpD